MPTPTKEDEVRNVNERVNEVKHRDNCPKKRAEAYDETQVRFKDGNRTTRPVEVIRCVDCGEYEIKEK